MLLRHTRVLKQVIRDLLIAPEEPGAAGVEVDGVDQILAFEDVDAPGFLARRFARFGRLVVFEDRRRAGDGVGFLCQEAGGLEVGFLFFLGRGGRVGGQQGFGALEGFVLGGKRGSGALVGRRRPGVGAFVVTVVVVRPSPPFGRWGARAAAVV